MGLCDRKTGLCQCFPGYTGRACDRTTCPNDCSGHGTCQSQEQFFVDASNALGGTHLPGGANAADPQYSTAWDAQKIYGCKCEAGYRGPDCSMKECPSRADPQNGPGGLNSPLNDFPVTNGQEFRDCSGRGLCDYSTGLCQCFKGAYGEACNLQSTLV